MTLDHALWNRAGAACAAAPPHRDADEDWPCNRCLLAAASNSGESVVPASDRPGFDGFAGSVTPTVPPGPAAGEPTVCRFAAFEWHQCARRDGRPCGPEACNAEHRAHMRDVTALSAEIDAAAMPLVSWLLSRRDEWGGR